MGGVASMTVRLIVNADDYGHTAGVSRGIREAHRCGIVTSTTAMMNMPDVEKALQQSGQECPRLGVGVHLVLTTGKPLLPASEVGTLVDAGGEFLGEEGLAAQIASVDLEQVRREWTAQVEKFIAIAGRAPDHLDSHHHAHYFSPGLCRAALELAQKYQCAVRFPTRAVGLDMLGDFSTEYAQECHAQNQELMHNYAIPSPDTFFKTFYDETCTLDYLLNALAGLPEGTTEMMCHPGYADAELIAGSSYASQRENELNLLTHEQVRKTIAAHRIELISFRDLK
jgi:chitin disaccharide deacetylase